MRRSTRALAATAVTAVVVGIALALPRATDQPAGPLTTHFDASRVCLAKTPSSDQIDLMLSGIRHRTLKAAAGGYTSTTTDNTGTSSFVYDAGHRRGQSSAELGFFTYTSIIDEPTSTQFDLVRGQDGPEAKNVLAKLGSDQAWVRQLRSTPDLAGDELSAGEIDTTLSSLGAAGEGAGPVTLTCDHDSTGRVVVTSAFHRATSLPAAPPIVTTWTFGFDAAGAETSLEIRDLATGAHSITRLNYGPQKVELPSPVITEQQWRSAVLRAYLPVLQASVTTAATTAVKTTKTLSARVSDVQSLAGAQAAQFAANWEAEGLELGSAKVADGARITVTDPVTGSDWYISFAVAGDTVVTTSHLG